MRGLGLGLLLSSTTNSFPVLAISPSSLTVAPEDTQTFSGSGGSGVYSFSISTNNSGGTINASTGAYQAGHTGTVTDTVRVTDTVTTLHADCAVTVTDAIAISPTTASKAPGQTQTFTGISGDGGYVYSIFTNNSGGSINSSTGLWTAGDTGSVVDTVRVTDENGEHADAAATVTAAISISPTSASKAPAGSQTYTGSGGSGGYVYSVLTNNSGGSINSSSGVYTVGNTGSVTDTIRVTDSVGKHADSTLTVTAVVAISPTTATKAPGASQTFTGSAGSGSGYVYSIVTNNSGGTINSSTGAYVAGSTGSVSDTVRVTDGNGRTADSVVTVTAVVAISPTTLSTTPAGTQTFTGSAGSGTGYVYSISTNNSGGTINSSTGAYVAGHTGSVTDTVRVTDSLGKTADATVTISASLAITGGATSVAGLGTKAFAATGGSGSGYTWDITANGGTSSAIVAGTGAYTAGYSWSGNTDTVRVTDSLGNTATAVVTLTVPQRPTLSTTCAGQFDAEQGITTSGGLVTTWVDQTGTLNNLTASGGNRPTYTAAAQNGLHGLTFATNQMGSTSVITTFTGATKYTWLFALKYTGSSSENAVDYLNDGIMADSQNNQGTYIDGTNIIASKFNQNDAKKASNNNFSIITSYDDASHHFVQLDQGTAVQGSASIAHGGTVGTLVVGTNGGLSTHSFAGYICEILIYKDDLGATDRLTAQKYLAAKWKNAAS